MMIQIMTASYLDDYEDGKIVEDHGAVEINRSVMQISPISRLPEKVGQVIASLHFLAVAKVIRDLVDHNLR